MGEVTEKIYCCDRDDNNNALAAAIIAGNNRRDDTFPNSKTGYLGALGEWQEVCNNKNVINGAMYLIGGIDFNIVSYWSSTQYSSNYDSWMFTWYYGYSYGNRRDHALCVRAFCQLSNNQNT